jgi:FKBP-type peptidyl-prolyl cis-trans isomerase
MNDKIARLLLLSVSLSGLAAAQDDSPAVDAAAQSPEAAFLLENRSKPGVVTLPSGLQYKVVRPGNGAKPKPRDTVVANFRGTLVDGTEFDTTYRRSSAAKLKLDEVIMGLGEGLALMREGARFQFFVPAELAYGSESPDSTIGPNATLIYEVELLLVEAPVEVTLSRAGKRQRDGAQFLRENGARPGVITLPSGLQYKELRAGFGLPPKRNGRVTVHYTGSLIDGTEFDSSYARGQPAEFRLRGVIPGWREALRLMPEGAHWELYVPPDLAYGKRGAPPKVGPNETLVFSIEMIKSR